LKDPKVTFGVVTESITPEAPIVGKDDVLKTTPLTVIGSPPSFTIVPPTVATVVPIAEATLLFNNAKVALALVVNVLSAP